MLDWLRLLVMNHRVITRGKMSGFMAIEGKREDGFWF